MKKNINRVKTIVRELSHFRTELLAKGYRKLAGYPERGFSSETQYRSFLKKHPSNDYFNEFMVTLVKIRKDLGSHIDTYNFYDIFRELYLYGKVSEATLERANATGCEWFPITKGSLVNAKNKLKPGLYIKIGEYSDLSHLKQFVTKGSKLFNGYKQLIWGQKKYKRVRNSPYAKCNKRIAALSKLSSSQLEKLGGESSPYKAMQISNIILKEGYGKISDGAVRKIIHRWKER